MKTIYKYIRFEEIEIPVFGKNKWQCLNKKEGYLLGEVYYLRKWKEWEFAPESDMGFTIECLNDIADFLNQLNIHG